MDTERTEHFDPSHDDSDFGSVDRYYHKNFNTDLEPEEEFRFHDWADDQGQKQGRDVLDDLTDYDLRGAFKDGAAANPETSHMPDKFKKPNHPTFSVDSIYNGTPDIVRGGVYEGGQWGRTPGPDGRETFTPSQKMLETTHPPMWLKGYMRQREPGVMLILPDKGNPNEP